MGITVAPAATSELAVLARVDVLRELGGGHGTVPQTHPTDQGETALHRLM